MQFEPTRIPEVVVVHPRVFKDERGSFVECWQQRLFERAGIVANFVQENHVRSVRHTLRGLHYQVLHPQGKLLRVTNGTTFDVAVDLRRGSATFGKWAGAVLSAENHCLFWVPPGFAHGVLALSESADLVYGCTEFYAPECERSIRWDDPDLAIDWPLPAGSLPLLSARDSAGQAFREAEYL